MSSGFGELTLQAQHLVSAGDLAGAQRLLADALTDADPRPDHASPELAEAAGLQARLLVTLGEPHSARGWAAFAYAASSRLYGISDQRTISAAATLAAVLHRVGSDARAARLYSEVILELTAHDGPESLRVLAAHADLATVEYARGQCSQARERLQDAWELHREVYGDGHASGIKMLARLGAMQRDCGRFDEAHDNLALARELARQHLAADDPLARQVAALARAAADPDHVCDDEPTPERGTPVVPAARTPPPAEGPPDLPAWSAGPVPPDDPYPPTVPGQRMPADDTGYPPDAGRPGPADRFGPPDRFDAPDRFGAAGPAAGGGYSAPADSGYGPWDGQPGGDGYRAGDGPGDAGYRDDTGYPGGSGYPTSGHPTSGHPVSDYPAPGHPAGSAYPAGAGHPARPGHPPGPGYPPEPGYPAEPGHVGGPGHPSGSGHSGGPGYPAGSGRIDDDGHWPPEPATAGAPGSTTGGWRDVPYAPPLSQSRRDEEAAGVRRVTPAEPPVDPSRLLPVLVPRRHAPPPRRPGAVPLVAAGVAVVLLGAVAVIAGVSQVGGSDAPPPAAPSEAAPTATTPNAGPPASPGTPPGRVTLRDRPDGITLTWTYPAGSEGPVVLSAAQAGQDPRPFQTLPPGTDNFVVHGLDRTTNYCFTVAVVWSTDVVARAKRVCTTRR
ncbi:tetratricopeptide repeat protein [Micromonospora sp. HM134]|uniref:tetratricopeptide repeat protein n=1 Tax=Micromonospora sp. HM134 TaxID=2583243 RepID=UPI00197C8AA2|nr:tetratricopeptide repeat protein [Micromonospora sp. HM134]